MIDIKSLSGDIRFSVPINKGCRRKFLLMKEDYITVKFSSDSPVHFKLGDYIEDPRFGIFDLCSLQKPDYNRKRKSYDYGLKFDAHYWKWKNKIFKFTPEVGGQEASWNLTASLDTQLGVFLRNLQALGYTYKGTNFEFSIDSSVENKSMLMSYDNTNLLDALSKMAETWDCEWWVEDNQIRFGRCEFGDPVDFEIGKNVEEMTRSDSQSTYATRIYAFGSTRNIPSNYRPVDESVVMNGIVQKRLMLPVGTPYIDAYPGMRTEEAIEQVVVFDDIYPRRVGTMSGISMYEYTDTVENEDGTTTEEKWNAYRFKDTGITFSEEYVLAGEELKITFQSGKLNGLEFAVKFNPDGKDEKLEDGSWNPEAQVWEIVRNDDYGRNLPGDVLVPENDDTYVLSGFDTKFVSVQMLPDAELELKEKAEKYVEKTKIDPSTYDAKMRYDDESAFLSVGDRVNLINKAYFENGRQSRIIGFEYNLDVPWDHPVYTIGETASYSRISDLEDKIDSLTLKGQTYNGGGGSGVYVIRTNDSTPPSNSNVFSALRAMAEFLSKTRPDIAREIITFLKGAHFGSDKSGKPIFIIDNEIKTSNFTEGDLGAGLVIKTLDNGNSYIEVDELFVRKLAYFVELTIKRLTHVGGEILLSPASMTCSRVEEFEDFYRCYFSQDDGDRSIVQEFRIGDQARSQTFNVKEGTSHNVSNQYYWRLVVGTGEDYIDLSKTDCDRGSTAPSAGDYIVQLGNRTDMSRQNAQVLSSYGSDAPSYKQYKGINSYSMDGKEMAVISPSGNKIIGDFILTTGKDVATMFQVVEGMIKTEIASVRYDLNVKDNYLSNTVFTGDLTGWETGQGIRLFTVGGKFLNFNNNFFSNKNNASNIVTHNGRYVLRMNNSSITQLNANLARHPEFELFDKVTVNDDGSTSVVGKSYKAKTFYVSFKCMVTAAGTLHVHFAGEGGNGFDDYARLDYSAYLVPSDSFVQIEIPFKWNGTGDFTVKFTGNMYIYQLFLAGNPLDDFTEKYSSKLEITDKRLNSFYESVKKQGDDIKTNTGNIIQTAKSLTVLYEEVAKQGDNITTNASSITQTAKSLTSLYKTVEDQGGVISSHESEIKQTSEAITMMVKKGDVISSINQSAEAVSISAGKIDLTGQVVINGSIRSPFRPYDDRFVFQGQTYTYDNIFPVQDSHKEPVYVGDGIWVEVSISSDWGNDTEAELQWDYTQIGRTICVSHYNGDDPPSSNGRSKICAPVGKYFYENGFTHRRFNISREIVTLKGLGNGASFWGWAVISRQDLNTTKTYGESLKCVMQGVVTGDSVAPSLRYKTAQGFDYSNWPGDRNGDGTVNDYDRYMWYTDSNGKKVFYKDAYGNKILVNTIPDSEIYKCHSGSNGSILYDTNPLGNRIVRAKVDVSVARLGKGVYRVYFPAIWGFTSDNYYVMLTGMGYSLDDSTRTAPIKATLKARASTYFDVWTSDDETVNDGSFAFQMFSMADWYVYDTFL